MKKIKKGQWFCPDCGSIDVEYKDWVVLNTGKATNTYEMCDAEDFWCPICKEHLKPVCADKTFKFEVEYE